MQAEYSSARGSVVVNLCDLVAKVTMGCERGNGKALAMSKAMKILLVEHGVLELSSSELSRGNQRVRCPAAAHHTHTKPPLPIYLVTYLCIGTT